MSENFFDWLARKYGFWEGKFYELDAEFQEILTSEYCSIAGER